MSKRKNFMYALCLSFTAALLPQQSFAVGDGLAFVVREGNVPGSISNTFFANSLDFTYHACTNVSSTSLTLKEQGYFWISSYQRPTSVINSQINYFLANGYRIYGRYNYNATQFAGLQPTPSGARLSYVVSPLDANITLYLDVSANTILNQTTDCKISSDKDTDDIKIGWSSTVEQGEKSETNGLANGDFKIVFSRWEFNPQAVENPITPLTTVKYDYIVINANLTRLRNSLGVFHRPEGSGNLYWKDKFTPITPTNPNPN